MAFTKSTEDLNVIQKLSNEPNDVDGLTAAQLKARFDEGANTLQRFVNQHIDELNAETAAENIGAVDANGEPTNMQAELGGLRESLDKAIIGAGGLPGGGKAGDVLVKRADGDYETGWSPFSQIESLPEWMQSETKPEYSTDEIGVDEKTAGTLKLEKGATADAAFANLKDNALDYATKPGDIYTTARTDLGDKWLLCNGANFDTNSEGYASEKLKELGFPLAKPSEALTEVDLSLLVTDGDTVLGVATYYMVVMDGVRSDAPSLVYKPVAPLSSFRTSAGACYDGVWVLVGSRVNGASMIVSRNPRDPESWVEKQFPVSLASVHCYNGLWVAVSSTVRVSGDNATYSPFYITRDPLGEWEHASDVGVQVTDFDYDGTYFACKYSKGVIYAADIYGPWTTVADISDLSAKDLKYVSAASKWVLLSSTTASTKIHTATTPDGAWTAYSVDSTANQTGLNLSVAGSNVVIVASNTANTPTRYLRMYKTAAAVASSSTWSKSTASSSFTSDKVLYTNGGYYFSRSTTAGEVLRSTSITSYSTTFRHSVANFSSIASCATDGADALLVGYWSDTSTSTTQYYIVNAFSKLGKTTWDAYSVTSVGTVSPVWRTLFADGKWLVVYSQSGAIKGWVFEDFFDEWTPATVVSVDSGTLAGAIYVDGVWCLSTAGFKIYTTEDPAGAWTLQTIPLVSATSAANYGDLAADENGTVVYSANGYYFVCEDIRGGEWQEVKIASNATYAHVSYSHGYWIRLLKDTSTNANYYYTQDLFGLWSQGSLNTRTMALFYASGRWWLIRHPPDATSSTILVSDTISGTFATYGGEIISYGTPAANSVSLVIFNDEQDFIYAKSASAWALMQSAVQQLPTIEADQAYAYIKVKE